MTEQTTPLDLDVITARAEAATPGPWEPIPTDPASVCSADDDGYWTRVADNVQLDADADFIAHAREDVPRLVAEVRRLTAALTEAEALLDKPLDPDDPCAEHDDHIWTDLALDRLAALRAILARTEQTEADR